MDNLKRYNCIIKVIISFVLAAVMGVGYSAAKDTQNGRDFTVVVDAGHGGKDIGAADNGVREKDINLGVALQLEKIIKKKLKDVKVVMTRDDDTYLTLQQRADVANKAKGDLFISIHTNSLDKSNKKRKTVTGTSVYALGLHKDDNNMKVARRENSVIELEQNYEQKYSGFDPSKDESYIIFEMAQKKNLSKSIKFANEAQCQLVKSGRNDRGVHQAGFWVLWATSMPAVLIELDFICNPTSAKYMTSSKGEKELAEAIFNAVESYYDDWEKSQSGVQRITASADEESMATGGSSHIIGSGSQVVVASTKTEVKKAKDSPAREGRKYADSKRRRRSDAARRTSSSRDVATNAIPLHSENERRGRIEDISEEVGPETVQSPTVSNDKKGKKAKKEKKKKEKKQDKKQNKIKRPSNAHNAKVEKFVTVYKIQILASDDLLKQDNPRFQGLTPVTAYRDNNLYKYYYGESQNEDEIRGLLQEVKKKIPDAFIVKSLKSLSSSKN